MQTPGRAVEPQTPMVPLERRMSSAYERLLTRAQEGAVTERPQIRGLGRVILEMEQLNNNMKSIQDEIRRDIRARRKYFEAEKKLLKKDIDNQSGFQAAALFDLRKVIGLASFGIAANEIAQGDIGGAAQGIGLGTAAFLPEIANGVIMILMARGLIGKGGGGMMAGGAVSGGLGLLGGGKGKGILALAALGGLLLTGNALASNSDSRRRQDISESIRGDSTINAPDVARFRSQLTTANSILSTVKDTKEEKQSSQFGGGADIQGQIAKALGKPNKGAKPAEASTISDSQTQTPVEPTSTVSDSQTQTLAEPISTVVPDTRSDQSNLASVQDDQDTAVSPWNTFFGSPAKAGTLDEFLAQGGVLPEQNTSNVELTGASKELIGSDKTFLTAIRQLAAKRGINEAQLLGLIASESSFDPTAVNKDTGATGLIQFMPEVAEALGTSQEEILKMSRAEQVALMDQYFEMNNLPNNPTAGQLKTNVLMPSYTNQDDSFELMTRHKQFTDGEAGNPNTYKVNQGLDYNKDGFVTVGEAGQSITNKMDEFGIGDLTNILSKKEKNKLDLGKRAGKNQWWDFLDLFENPKQKQNLEQQSNEGSGTKPVIINQGGTTKKLPPPPPPLPDTASSHVNVSTTFSGSIDKLESAYALETYAAFG